MQSEKSVNFDELVGFNVINKIITKKGNNGKIWKLDVIQEKNLVQSSLEIDPSSQKLIKSCNIEYYYCGEIDEKDNFEGSGVLVYYKNPILKYDGSFKNGKKHGNGIEKYADGDTYNGEFKNNLKNGNGTLYSKDGTIKYSGQWLEDEPTNEMVYYSYDEVTNNKKYFGSFKNGKYNGMGIMFDQVGYVIQLGEYKNGLPVRTLDFYNTNKIMVVKRLKKIMYQNKFEFLKKHLDLNLDLDLKKNLKEPYNVNTFEPIKDYFVETICNGDMIYFSTNGNIIYTGNTKNNKFNGDGVYNVYTNDQSCHKYEMTGIFENDALKEGQIINKQYIENNNVMFKGTFIETGLLVSGDLEKLDTSIITNAAIQGTLQAGKYYYNEFINVPVNYYNRCFEGTFKNGQFEKGILSILNENRAWIMIYEGTFNTISLGNYKKYHGNGIEYYEVGNIKKYEGEFKDGKYHGHGRLYNSNKLLQYAGSFQNGLKHGRGILYNDGEFVFEGNFLNDNIN